MKQQCWGIPIVKVLKEGLVANEILWISGIINGTTNYILSEMEKGVWDLMALRKQNSMVMQSRILLLILMGMILRTK